MEGDCRRVSLFVLSEVSARPAKFSRVKCPSWSISGQRNSFQSQTEVNRRFSEIVLFPLQ